MAKHKGNLAFLRISADGGSTYNDLGNMKSLNIALSADEVDFTDFDTNGWKDIRSGLKEGTISGDGNRNTSDQAQLDLINFWMGADGQQLKAQFAFIEETGQPQYSVDIGPTQNDQALPNQEASTFSFSFRMQGQPVESIQS